jgi:O-antigen ligase
MPDRHLFYLFLFTLIWMPLPAGSNWPWAWIVLQMLVFVTAFGWLIVYGNEKITLTKSFLKAKPVIVMLALWLCWVLIQTLPLPTPLVELLSSHSARQTLDAAQFIEKDPGFISVSVDPYQTFQKFMLSAALVVFFLLALVLLNSRERIKLTLWVIVYSALFQAVFGSLMALSGVEYHLFGPKQHNLGLATGTFINRNHLAGYLVMSLTVGIGLLLSQLRTKRHQILQQQLRDWLGVILGKKMQLRIILAILVIGLVMTRSRMGNSAFFISLLACSFLWVFLSRRRPTTSVVVLFVSLIVIDLYIVGTWFGFEQVVERMEHSSVDIEKRGDIGKSVMIAIPEFGLSGSGLGTFKTVFPNYKDSGIQVSYLYAHNDYLQFILEGGLAVLLLFAILVMTIFTAYMAMRVRKDPLYRGIGFASLMGVIAILIHSAVDFNLQIPANAMMFVLLLALAWIGRYGVKHER